MFFVLSVSLVFKHPFNLPLQAQLVSSLSADLQRFGEVAAVVAALLDGGLVGNPLDADAVVDEFEAAAAEQTADQFYALAAPAVAAECGGLFVLEFHALRHLEQTCDGMCQTVVDGWRPHEYGLRCENLGQHVILVFMSCIVDLNLNIGINFLDATCNLLSHDAGAVPHGVVDDSDFVLLVVGCPLLVFLNDEVDILTPNHAMAWAN